MSSAHSPSFQSLHLRHSSFWFSKLSVTSPTSQLIQSLENELCSFSKLSVTSPTSQLILILQAFRHFTYVTAHSPTLLSLYLRPNSFSNPSVASPTSQLIPQPFFRFSYVTSSSLTSPGEPPMKHCFNIDEMRLSEALNECLRMLVGITDVCIMDDFFVLPLTQLSWDMAWQMYCFDHETAVSRSGYIVRIKWLYSIIY